ncbi:oxidoreductase [Thermoplasmatales archaeon SW_10_69_26]|nr:MAG: oxidoreductase [Thermoplasmatales archaeon SW_10_69_26]
MTAELPTIALPGTGDRVPRIGQGTWRMEQDDRRDCIQTLRHGVDLGATLIDTAEMYGSGTVEEIVGEALDGIREEVFLTSKILPRNADREGTVEACERSLRRLDTDHLDLYLLHWPSSHPIEETMAGFRELLDEGLVRSVGVSNCSLEQFVAADEALGPDHDLVTDQVLYWLGSRNVENELLGGLREREVPLMAYSPLGQAEFPDEGTPPHDALSAIADDHGATIAQVMLAWVLRHEDVFTIPKTSSIDHLEENLAAAEIELRAEDLERLDEVYPATDSSRIPTL